MTQADTTGARDEPPRSEARASGHGDEDRRGGHDPYGALRLPDYRRFLLAGIVGTVGGQVQGVAVGWDLYEKTRSPMILGLVGLVQFLPVVLLAFPAGHAADRYRRKDQFLVAQVVMTLASAGLAVLSRVS